MIELNIVSMNLRKETEEDGENNWPERIGLVVRLINEVEPSAEASYGQARVLKHLLEEQNSDSLPGSAPYKTLTSSLKDVWFNTHPHDAGEGTWHGFSGKAQKGRLDWILASPGVQTREAGILRNAYEGRYPSDHFPVKAVLEVG